MSDSGWSDESGNTPLIKREEDQPLSAGAALAWSIVNSHEAECALRQQRLLAQSALPGPSSNRTLLPAPPEQTRAHPPHPYDQAGTGQRPDHTDYLHPRAPSVGIAATQPKPERDHLERAASYQNQVQGGFQQQHLQADLTVQGSRPKDYPPAKASEPKPSTKDTSAHTAASSGRARKPTSRVVDKLGGSKAVVSRCKLVGEYWIKGICKTS